MADIATVLKKTIDGLPSNSPEIRKKVYDRARATIAAKLEAKDPKPSAEVIEKQLASVDKVISAVEADYVFKEQVDDVLGEALADKPSEASAAVPPRESPAPVSSPKPAVAAPKPEPAKTEALEPAIDPAADPTDMDQPLARAEPMAATGATAAKAAAEKPKGRGARLAIWAAVLLLILGGGGYAAWTNQEVVAGWIERVKMAIMPADKPAGGAGSDTKPAKAAGADPATPASPAENPEPATGDGSTAPATDSSSKFAQRLNPDGTETDDGPATKPENQVGEGTSVAEATTPSQPKDTGQPPAPAGNGTDSGAAPAVGSGEAPAAGDSAQQAVAVGQRAIFYEERFNTEQGTADEGNVVWSVIQESPGGNLPAEPAIQAALGIPARGINLRMTIRRNGDTTLPASHIIELFFETPENFPGGSIEDVLRVTFKDSEKSPGRPVVGVPAKIADGFFLVALVEGTAEEETNLLLMKDQQWMDIPITYSNGRRALITLEKGIPGDRVFDEVMKSWEAKANSG